MFARLLWILTLNCRPFSRLASDALDRRLSASERTAMAGHWLTCKSCRRFRRQLHLLQHLALHLDPTAPGDADRAMERIRHRLREHFQADL